MGLPLMTDMQKECTVTRDLGRGLDIEHCRAAALSAGEFAGTSLLKARLLAPHLDLAPGPSTRWPAASYRPGSSSSPCPP